jgi:type IV secretion system protein VirB5
MKFKTIVIALCVGASIATQPAHAFLGLDGDVATETTQILSWAAQYAQMVKELQQLEKEYASLNGVRGMANLVNSPISRKYLPEEYKDVLANGVGQWEVIYNTAKRFDISTSSLGASSDSAQAFKQIGKQAALNRAAAEEAYKNASKRFADIQALLEKVNDAPDAKDIADLQARIQAEQVMMQNEANKLAALAQLASAQRDLQMQQAAERRMKATRGDMPAW